MVVEDYMGTIRDMKQAKGQHSLNLEYVLPDFGEINRGFIKEETGEASDLPDDSRKRKASGAAQTVQLGHERFSIPELLFRPSDIGIDQAGVGPAVRSAVAALEPCKCEVCAGWAAYPGGDAELALRAGTRGFFFVDPFVRVVRQARYLRVV